MVAPSWSLCVAFPQNSASVRDLVETSWCENFHGWKLIKFWQNELRWMDDWLIQSGNEVVREHLKNDRNRGMSIFQFCGWSWQVIEKKHMKRNNTAILCLYSLYKYDLFVIHVRYLYSRFLASENILYQSSIKKINEKLWRRIKRKKKKKLYENRKVFRWNWNNYYSLIFGALMCRYEVHVAVW